MKTYFEYFWNYDKNSKFIDFYILPTLNFIIDKQFTEINGEVHLDLHFSWLFFIASFTLTFKVKE